MILHDVYNVNGLLKQKFSDYQVREGQVKMSELVEQALKEKKSAVIEGATGVGKGFGYLIPSILTGKRVIVSTSNKSLQDQLDKKDLPMLQSVLGIPLSWAVLKGKSNYFCNEHFSTNEMEITNELMGDRGLGTDFDLARLKMEQVRKWVAEDEIGDMEYCPIELTHKAKELMCCSANTSHEKESEAMENCYAARARARAKEAQIVLVNHTLLALDMNLRKDSEGHAGFLPTPEAIIIDEAHEFEKAAILAFSDEISIFSLLHLLNWKLVKKELPEQKRKAVIDSLQKVLDSYMPQKGITGYYQDTKHDYFNGLGDVVEGINDVIHTLARLEGKGDEKTIAMAKQITKEAETLQDRLQDISKEDANALRWAEAKDNARGQAVVKLRTVPLDISPMIQEGLFGDGKSVIACSATLSVFGSFSYFKEQIGMPMDTLEMVVPSPFDYKQQALVYISDGSNDKFYEMAEMLRMSKGRAFILFTSYKDMKQAYDFVQTPHPKFIQSNDVPRSQLLEDWKNTPNAVLFATKSFWEGVDIKGDKLSLVIIDKIPFENPKNLVFGAKCERIDAKFGRGKSFIKLFVPDACIKLKQGVGRLIRSSSDRGVIALLDARVNYKPYGNMIIESLPPAYRTQQLPKVEKFFEKINQ